MQMATTSQWPPMVTFVQAAKLGTRDCYPAGAIYLHDGQYALKMRPRSEDWGPV